MKPSPKDDDDDDDEDDIDRPTPEPTSPVKIVIKNEGDKDDDTDNTKTVVIEKTDDKKLPPIKVIDQDGEEVEVKVTNDGKKMTFKINEGDKVTVVDVRDGAYKITSVDKATKNKTEIKFKVNDNKIHDDNGTVVDGVYRLKDKTGRTALVATGEKDTLVVLAMISFMTDAAFAVSGVVLTKKKRR